MSEPVVADAPERGRFEIAVEGEVVGFTEYRRRAKRLAFVHTEIDPAHSGRGLANALIGAALDAARAEGAEVLPFCPFVRDFIEAHNEYLDLVPEAQRQRFRLG